MTPREQRFMPGSERNRGRRVWTLVWLIVANLLLVGCLRPQETPGNALPETGYLVQPAFTSYYETFGPRLLGEPISGLCQAASGRQVQYFQNMRLEIGTDGESISVYPLGEWAYAGLRRKTAAPVPENSRARLFPETGFEVRDEFLDFYEQNGGDVLLGLPVSPQLDEGTLRVQYFRNGRLEWHPGAAVEQRVQLGMLGQAHYLQAAQDVTCEFRSRPVDVTTVNNVSVLASAEAPILYTGDEQMIYAMVTTGAGVPVAGVPVTLTLRDTDWTLTVDLGRTDAAGKVQGGLHMPRFVPGRMVGVIVDAQGLGGRQIGRTGLAFQTWW